MEFLFSLRERERWEFILAHRLEAQFTNSLCAIALPSLRNVPQSRLDCLRLLEYLLLHEKDTHLLTNLHFEPLLSELLFLMSEIPGLREAVLLLLKLMLEEAGMEQLSLMLQRRVHVVLTRGMEWAMQEHNNHQLEHCLAGLFSILTRLSLNEQKLMHRVKADIETVDFHHMIEGLLHNEQNEVIAGLVNNIVDDFYSEEVEEHV